MKPKPPSCRSCPLYGSGQGYVPQEGEGTNGVLVILESAGEDEAAVGRPTVGKAGHFLWSNLKRVSLEREDFRIHNVLSCQPPGNKLAGAPYEESAILRCAPFLTETIDIHKAAAKARGQTPVILALGVIAFRRVMGLQRHDPILHKDYHGYMHWSQRHECWVIAGFHPSYLMRGNHHEVLTLLWAAQRAVDVAANGFEYAKPELILDPEPIHFLQWVREYQQALADDPTTYLSVDIETPKKQKSGEDELSREDEEDYIILRCSFAYNTSQAVSIPWNAAYTAIVEELLADPRNNIVGWNLGYDIPRLKNQLTVNGTLCDGMLWWHVLNSSLDKRLGFVTPYYWQTARMWKHLSAGEPALYNALDALAALINIKGIKRDLEKAGQWSVVDRHVIQLGKVLNAMSAVGLPRDEKMRVEAEAKLTDLLTETETKIAAAIPDSAKKLKVYKKKPKDMTGVKVRVVENPTKTCVVCGLVNPKKPHFKAYKTTRKVNLCGGATTVLTNLPTEEYYKELDWKPSKVSLTSYQTVSGQRAIWNRQKGTTTFDENAIRSLRRTYPTDPLYPLIIDHRQYQKLRGTYIGITQPDGTVKGGLQTGRDGRIHAEFSMNPSTLRLACQNPNMQNLPRVTEQDALESIVRNLIVAGPGCMLVEADFSAIEAVLVGYFARDPDYIRLAKLGVHSYLASHVLGRPADLKWSDADLKTYFKEIKKSEDAAVQRIYNGSKRTVHLSAYGGTPRKMHLAEAEIFPTIKDAERLQDIYWQLCPKVRKWQLEVQLEAHQNGHLINPFQYRHAFPRVFHNVKENGQWVRKPGEDVNAVLAFLPQSTAAAILKESMLRLYFQRHEAVGQYLRLQVHDSLVSEVPLDKVEEVVYLKKMEMTKPVPELRLPASYGLGECLVIDVDTKQGLRWGSLS